MQELSEGCLSKLLGNNCFQEGDAKNPPNVTLPRDLKGPLAEMQNISIFRRAFHFFWIPDFSMHGSKTGIWGKNGLSLLDDSRSDLAISGVSACAFPFLYALQSGKNEGTTFT